MTPETVFQLANMLAPVGWLALLASPLAPREAQLVGGLAVPCLLSVLYAGLILANWSGGEGGYGTLADVAKLFENRALLLAGWVHFLAFDLFVGAWEVRAARRAGLPFWAVVPCLVTTFMFGPAGLTMFLAARLALAPRASLRVAV